eukprot:scaffold109321_cov57-Phaeocystis_antarctica.AAC.1
MRASVRRRPELELEKLHREPPGGVPVILARCGGRPLGGGPVVGERVRAIVVPGAVAVRGDLRPRAEVRIARVDLDVLRAFEAPVRGAGLPISAAPGVLVVKREDEVDVVGAVHAVVPERVECVWRTVGAELEAAPEESHAFAILAIDTVLRRPLPLHARPPQRERRRAGGRRGRRGQADDRAGSEVRAAQVGVGEVGLSEVNEGSIIVIAIYVGSELRATEVGVGEVGLSEGDGGKPVVASGEHRATQVCVGEVGFIEVDEAGFPTIAKKLRATQVGVGEVGFSEVDGGVVPESRGMEQQATQVTVREVGLSEVDGGAVLTLGSELQVAQTGVRERGFSEVDDGGVVGGLKLRATQGGVGEVGPSEVDDGGDVIAPPPPLADLELRFTQVGVREVGLSEVDDGLVALGIEPRATHSGVREVGRSKIYDGEVGVGEVGVTEVDEGVAEAAIGSELRATQDG